MRRLHLTFSHVIMTGGHEMLWGVWDFIISFANMKMELFHCLKTVHLLCTFCHFFPFFLSYSHDIYRRLCVLSVQGEQDSKTDCTAVSHQAWSYIVYGTLLVFQLGSDLLTSRGEAECLRKDHQRYIWKKHVLLDAGFVVNLRLLGLRRCGLVDTYEKKSIEI